MTKFLKFYRNLIVPAGLLSALIIGAGMFSLPAVFERAGILTGFFYLAAFTLVFSAVHLMYAEIIEKTAGDHRFAGYAKIYLGRPGFVFSILITFFTILTVLIVYLVLSASFIRLLFPSISGVSAALIFWLAGTVAALSGVKRMAGPEFFIFLAMALIIFSVFVYGIFFGEPSRIALASFNPKFVLLPFGPVFFSLAGRAAISSIREYFKKNRLDKRNLAPAIVLGTVAPAILYSLFILGILMVSRGAISADAVSGLAGSRFLGAALGILGLFSLWTSYVFLAMEFKGILNLDFRFSRLAAGLSAALLPILFYLSGVRDFLLLIAVAGGIFGVIESALVVLMWQRARKKASLCFLLLPLFALGLLYEMFKIF